MKYDTKQTPMRVAYVSITSEALAHAHLYGGCDVELVVTRTVDSYKLPPDMVRANRHAP